MKSLLLSALQNQYSWTASYVFFLQHHQNCQPKFGFWCFITASEDVQSQNKIIKKKDFILRYSNDCHLSKQISPHYQKQTNKQTKNHQIFSQGSKWASESKNELDKEEPIWHFLTWTPWWTKCSKTTVSIMIINFDTHGS